MKSKSDKANSVRDYFILLHKFIEYYKNHIAEMINKKASGNKCMYIILVDKDK
jgi:hypothetical protein